MRLVFNKASKLIAGIKYTSLVLCMVLASSVSYADSLDISCDTSESGAAILVHVSNIRYQEGNLRAQIYSSNPDEFLASGKKLFRIDVPVAAVAEQDICVPVPAPDTYALVVMHDRNANGKADFFSEGFGFSNNPKLKLSPPDAEDVMIEVPEGVLEVPVELYYILGSGDEETKKRRKMRRR